MCIFVIYVAFKTKNNIQIVIYYFYYFGHHFLSYTIHNRTVNSFLIEDVNILSLGRKDYRVKTLMFPFRVKKSCHPHLLL